MTAGTVGAVLLAGAVGAALRAVVVAALPRTGITAVNLVGTVVLAAVAALAGSGRASTTVAAVLGLGFAGSLTTFSGWVERVVEGSVGTPVRTAIGEVVLPLLAAVGLVVATFVLVP